MAANWYGNALTASRTVERPRALTPPVVINDTTTSIVPGVQASGFSFLAVGANPNRVYLLIQNNTAVNIAIAVGNAASPQGLLILPGGYYERQLYSFISSVYITVLGATVATDYVTVEEGSSVRTA